jgi:electron transfer flavoprotein beta subunit
VKILVPIKRVPDPATTIRVLPDGSGIATDNVKWVINPFDEIAIEEALRIKEKQGSGEVVLITVGQSAWQEQLRTGLAMGADRSILVKTDAALDTLAIAQILAKVAGDEKPDLILLGKQAIDDDSNQIGQMLAELLGWPQATFASKLEIADGKVTVIREVDGGLETIAFSLPSRGAAQASGGQEARLGGGTGSGAAQRGKSNLRRRHARRDGYRGLSSHPRAASLGARSGCRSE